MFRRPVCVFGLLVAITAPSAYAQHALRLDMSYGTNSATSHALCQAGGTTVVVASHASPKFGWDAGLAVGSALGNGSSQFLEARYTWIDTSNERLT